MTNKQLLLVVIANLSEEECTAILEYLEQKDIEKHLEHI